MNWLIKLNQVDQNQRLRQMGVEILDARQLGSYELVLTRMPNGAAVVGLQRKGLDFTDRNQQLQQHEVDPLVDVPDQSEIKQVLNDWIGRYGKLFVGSYNSRLMEKYRRILQTLGYEPMDEHIPFAPHGIFSLDRAASRNWLSRLAFKNPVELVRNKGLKAIDYLFRQDPGIRQDWEAVSKNIREMMVDAVIAADPSKNKSLSNQYIPWILKYILFGNDGRFGGAAFAEDEQNYVFEDGDRFYGTLAELERLKRRTKVVDGRPVKVLSPEDIKGMLDSSNTMVELDNKIQVKNEETMSGTEKRRQKEEQMRARQYQVPSGSMLPNIPEPYDVIKLTDYPTTKGMCQGKNIKWCVQFEETSKNNYKIGPDNPLYMIMKSGQQYLLMGERSKQLKKPDDSLLTEQEAQEVAPVLIALNQMGLKMPPCGDFKILYKSIDYFRERIASPENIAEAAKSPNTAWEFYDLTGMDPPEIVQAFIDRDDRAYSYAEDKGFQVAPEVINAFLDNTHLVYLYADKMNGQVFPKAWETIAKQPDVAYQYAESHPDNVPPIVIKSFLRQPRLGQLYGVDADMEVIPPQYVDDFLAGLLSDDTYQYLGRFLRNPKGQAKLQNTPGLYEKLVSTPEGAYYYVYNVHPTKLDDQVLAGLKKSSYYAREAAILTQTLNQFDSGWSPPRSYTPVPAQLYEVMFTNDKDVHTYLVRMAHEKLRIPDGALPYLDQYVNDPAIASMIVDYPQGGVPQWLVEKALQNPQTQSFALYRYVRRNNWKVSPDILRRALTDAERAFEWARDTNFQNIPPEIEKIIRSSPMYAQRLDSSLKSLRMTDGAQPGEIPF